MPEELKFPTIEFGTDTPDLDGSFEKDGVRDDVQNRLNETISALQRLHGKEATVENLTQVKSIYKSGLKQKRFLHRLDNIEEITAENDRWANNEKKIIDSLGGPFTRKAKEAVDQFRILLTNEGIRIGENKILNKARNSIVQDYNETVSYFKENDAVSAKKGLDQLKAKINLFESKGVLSSDEASAYRKNISINLSDNIVKQGLENNEYIEVTQGRKPALDDIKQFKTNFKDELGTSDVSTKTLFARREKLLKDSKNNPLPKQQALIDNVGINFLSNRVKASKYLGDIDDGIEIINNQIANKQFTPEGLVKANNYKTRLKTVKKIVEKLKDTGDALNRGGGIDVKANPILDFSKSNAVVADALGIKTNTAGFETFLSYRKALYDTFYVKGDSVQTGINMYNFLASAGEGNKRYEEPKEENYPDKATYLKQRAGYEKTIGLAVGQQGLSGDFSNTFEELLTSPDLGDQAAVAELIQQNPELLTEYTKYRSSTENISISHGSQQLLNRYRYPFGFNEGQSLAIHTAIKNDPNAESLYNKTYSMISREVLNPENLENLKKLTGLGADDIISTLAFLAFRDFQSAQQGFGGFKYISTNLNNKGSKKVRSFLEESVAGYIDIIKESKVIKNQAAIYKDSPLNKNTDEANTIVGAFSKTKKGIIGRVIESIDVGTRDARPLDLLGQTKLESYIKGLVPKEVRSAIISEKLRIQHHQGSFYEIGLEDDYGNFNMLRDTFNEPILINDELAETLKIKDGQEATYVIDVIKRSNP